MTTTNWQESLTNLITDPEELIRILKLETSLGPAAIKAAQYFPLRVTHSFVERMQPGNAKDPLLLQVLPLAQELSSPPDYSTDPLAEKSANVTPGLIHKYTGRVLFITAPQCAINCRYCFRRHFDYTANTPSRKEWEQALNYIQNDSSIEEVIFSGGDPLVLADKQIEWLINQLEKIPHVVRLRIHSRLPIVLPERLTPSLKKLLTETRLLPVLVIHCNHPQEINKPVTRALAKYKDAGITLLNQSVLLKNINDDSDIICELSKQLFSIGVLPYYLHLLDKVSGAAHFDINKPQQIYQELLKKLPGYLVPKIVKECPLHPYKVPISQGELARV